MKDLIWTAIISIVLAGAATILGLYSLFTTADLLPAVQGCGLASVAFGLASLSEKLDVTNNRAE